MEKEKGKKNEWSVVGRTCGLCMGQDKVDESPRRVSDFAPYSPLTCPPSCEFSLSILNSMVS